MASGLCLQYFLCTGIRGARLDGGASIHNRQYAAGSDENGDQTAGIPLAASYDDSKDIGEKRVCVPYGSDVGNTMYASGLVESYTEVS